MRSGMSKSQMSAISGTTNNTVAASAMEARSIAATEMQTMTAGHKGFIIAWGNNQYGQLGLTGSALSADKKKQKRGEELKPMRVPADKIGCPPTLMYHPFTSAFDMPSVSMVACGEHHSIAVCQDGTLWTWGRNNCGQLGHGDAKDNKYKIPTQVMALAKKICIKAAAGGQHSLALTDANKIYAWGNNNFGQLGMGTRDAMLNRPDIVTSMRRSGACHIVCGYSHSVALLKNEQLFVWGRNDCGQLGLGHYTHSPTPEHVTALKKFQVQQVSCGYDHVIAFVGEDLGPDAPPLEKVYSWGRGEEGQLGHNDTYSRCVPKVIATLEARGVRAVAAGGFSSSAIDEAKQVYTWGDSRQGQLGHGDETSLSCPAILKKPFAEDEDRADEHATFRARTVVLGPSYMLAMGLDEQSEKTVDPSHDSEELNKYSWGANTHGQLGMPYINAKKQKNYQKTNQPEKIPFLSKFQIREISCGLEHVVAVVDVPMVKQTTGTTPIERLRKALAYLANGEFEDDVYGDEAQKQSMLLMRKAEQEQELGLQLVEEDDDVVYGEMESEEDEDEKLHYPKQIYDRVHDVRPLIVRLGLHEYANFFETQQIDFDSFLTLEHEDLIDIGVDRFGARRRIMRAVMELRNALAVDEPPEDDEGENDFDPPEYEREEQEGLVPLKPGFSHHEADFLPSHHSYAGSAPSMPGHQSGVPLIGDGGGLSQIGEQFGDFGKEYMDTLPNNFSGFPGAHDGYAQSHRQSTQFSPQPPPQPVGNPEGLFGIKGFSLPFFGGNQNGAQQSRQSMR